MSQPPLILTLGRERNYLEKLNRQARARGLNVIGAVSMDDLEKALANPRVAAVVLGGAIDPSIRRGYEALITDHRPDIAIHLHDLRDGEHAFVDLIEAASATETER